MEQIEKQHFQKTFYGEAPQQHIRLRGHMRKMEKE